MNDRATILDAVNKSRFNLRVANDELSAAIEALLEDRKSVV